MGSESTLFQSALEVAAAMEVQKPERAQIAEEIDEEEAEENEENTVEQIQTESESEVYTPLSANEDPESKAAYLDYKLIERNIMYQNKTLENLKDEIKKMTGKCNMRRSEKTRLKHMYNNWERERLKLQDLISKAINLQNSGSKRHYRQFPIVTTFEEDNFNLSHDLVQKGIYDRHRTLGNCRASAGESKKINAPRFNNENHASVSEERQLVKEIIDLLKQCNNLNEIKEQKQKHDVPGKGKKSLEEIKINIKCLQQAICKLTDDLEKRSHQSNRKSCATSSMPDLNPPSSGRRKCLGNANKLEENYLYLLKEFRKENKQLEKLRKNCRNACSKRVSGSGSGDPSAEESELLRLRNRVNQMKDEQVEFQCLMREQSLQLDEYRNKYLMAQQKVEEQCALIEKLNMNNKCLEKQINEEVKEIRAKFQERLADLLKFPKLLENEQIKLAKACKEKQELESKLVIVCKELKSLKSKPVTAAKTNDEDCKSVLNRCQQELSHVKKRMAEIQKQRDMFCVQLETTMEDLNTLRSESTKIIARTKERFEFVYQEQKRQIDRLEKQLAQCRATACLSVSDRENVINIMQGQLNTLSYSFDAAQKQIKILRNHVACMSNENNFVSNCW